MAIAAVILALAGLLLFWVPVLGFLLAALAVVFAALALGRCRAQRERGSMVSEALPVTGLVLGILGLVPSMIIVLILVLAGMAAGDGPSVPVEDPSDITRM